jgi:uncharacterized protein YndB with AHSA1/START domain
MTQQAPVTAPLVLPFGVPPVVKTVHVDCSPQDAFDRFTRDIHLWWPMHTHSVHGSQATSVAFEAYVGGRLFETSGSGEEEIWGTVTVWDAPNRLAFTWHVGRSPDTTQSVEVTFTTSGLGTQVQLVHSGWERLGSNAERLRAEYDGGWNLVFTQRYLTHVQGGTA